MLNKHENIHRQESKMNMNTIVETFLKKRKFGLFDKFWYLKRAENFDWMEYQGVHIDGQQVVEVDFKHFYKSKGKFSLKDQSQYETKTDYNVPD